MGGELEMGVIWALFIYGVRSSEEVLQTHILSKFPIV